MKNKLLINLIKLFKKNWNNKTNQQKIKTIKRFLLVTFNDNIKFKNCKFDVKDNNLNKILKKYKITIIKYFLLLEIFLKI